MQPVELAIEHVREPGERLPVAAMTGGEGPADPLHRQPLGDLGIFID